MLRFCKVCKKIQDERWMHSADICELCRGTAEERRTTQDKELEQESKAGPVPVGEEILGAFLPGLEPAQGESHE